MLVKELIAELQRHNPEAQVLHSNDAEGNCYTDMSLVDSTELDKQVVLYPSGLNYYDWNEDCTQLERQ